MYDRNIVGCYEVKNENVISFKKRKRYHLYYYTLEDYLSHLKRLFIDVYNLCSIPLSFCNNIHVCLL